MLFFCSGIIQSPDKLESEMERLKESQRQTEERVYITDMKSLLYYYVNKLQERKLNLMGNVTFTEFTIFRGKFYTPASSLIIGYTVVANYYIVVCNILLRSPWHKA